LGMFRFSAVQAVALRHDSARLQTEARRLPCWVDGVCAGMSISVSMDGVDNSAIVLQGSTKSQYSNLHHPTCFCDGLDPVSPRLAAIAAVVVSRQSSIRRAPVEHPSRMAECLVTRQLRRSQPGTVSAQRMRATPVRAAPTALDPAVHSAQHGSEAENRSAASPHISSGPGRSPR
jgi:hypothetical protein